MPPVEPTIGSSQMTRSAWSRIAEVHGKTKPSPAVRAYLVSAPDPRRAVGRGSLKGGFVRAVDVN